MFFLRSVVVAWAKAFSSISAVPARSALGKVDDAALATRIEKRAAETRAAGGTVRADDNVEALKTRLMAYYRETSPLIGYYYAKNRLHSVDGMVAIDDVAKAIDKVLAGLATVKPATEKKN